MLDPKLLRADIEQVAVKLKLKQFDLDIEAFKALEERRKTTQTRTQELQSE